jgi:hypothetical protein
VPLSQQQALSFQLDMLHELTRPIFSSASIWFGAMHSPGQ